MRAVHEAGWEPDADLRPEGRSGPLARSMAGYLEYWERYADPWEFQSLLRARHVAGDADLGRRFELNAADFAYPPDGLTLDRVVEVRRMRERIERERVKPPEAARFHFKLGHGSLADVQFAVELSLMRFGGQDEQVRSADARGARAARGGAPPGGPGRSRPRGGVRVPVGREERPGDGPADPRRGGPGGAGRADGARPAPRLRGISEAGVPGALPARDPKVSPRDGAGIRAGAELEGEPAC